MEHLEWIEKLMALEVETGEQREEDWGYGRVSSALLSLHNAVRTPFC